MSGIALILYRRCISQYDFVGVQYSAHEETLEGIEELPEDYEEAVLESLEKGEVIVPPMMEMPEPTKKSRAKNKTSKADENTSAEVGSIEKETTDSKNDEADAIKTNGTIMLKESLSNEDSSFNATSSTTEGVTQATTAGELSHQKKSRKRKKKDAGNGTLDEELATQDKALKKRKIAEDKDVLPAERTARERQPKAAPIKQDDTVEAMTRPLRRSARQAARIGASVEAASADSTPWQLKHKTPQRASPLVEMIAGKKAKVASKDQKQQASTATKVSKKDHKAKKKVRRAKSKALKAANENDSIRNTAAGIADADVNMDNIAELREFMRVNFVPRRVQRY